MTAMRKRMLAGCASLVVAAGIGVSAPAAHADDVDAGGKTYSLPGFPYYTDNYGPRFLADDIMPKAAMAKLTPKQRNALRFGPTSAASAQACYDKWKFYVDPGSELTPTAAYLIRCNFEEVTVGEYLQTVGVATGAFIGAGFDSVMGSLGRITGSL
ncbi:hypothetical protein [Corynebacterium bovis]|uniref:hypothetical protein n=1 Tax=Corynebacterium bovis TaxID=36808 RepID=UPI000F6461B3|nr:hypothetical protein [Corynebacterium bovis]RRO95019.1 hypothetical protein CXF29_05935 [Corynebacterium bovis]RRQ13092.1 hypothetical protein CXF47_07445 [Corynebacterium bovis]RRQ15334.1 hypothetical protein CXF46_08910 [Corynebacterium bovis]